jgi:hypothetical protein
MQLFLTVPAGSSVGLGFAQARYVARGLRSYLLRQLYGAEEAKNRRREFPIGIRRSMLPFIILWILLHHPVHALRAPLIAARG